MSQSIHWRACRRAWIRRALLAGLLGVAALPADAQAPAPTPASLEDLLRQVETETRQIEQVTREREQRFAAARAEQQRLLTQAEADAGRADAQVGGLKDEFAANQRAIAALEADLAARGGAYQAVAGAARDATQGFLAAEASLPTAIGQEARLDTLRRLAGGEGGVAPDDPRLLTQTWLAMQTALTAQARVTTIDGAYLDATGARQQGPLTRLGPFGLLAGGLYLEATPGQPPRVLAPQPRGDAVRLADAFTATDGPPWREALLDPLRGEGVKRLAARPTLWGRIEQGGWVPLVILGVGAAGFAVAAFQLVFLVRARLAVRRQLRAPERLAPDNALGRVLLALKAPEALAAADPEILELRLSEAVLRETPRLERFQGVIRLIIAAGPLLGLLGTVAGMIETFQVITEHGAADPKLMAGGISQAMISTVLGLFIAIPLLFVNAWLVTLSRGLTQVLDEQSAGLLAARLEARHGL